MFDLVINVERVGEDAPSTILGLATAQRLGAFATGIHVVAVYPPIMTLPEAMTLLDTEERAALAHAGWWKELCRRYGVRGEWEVIRGSYVPILAKRSRLAQFVVTELPVSNPDSPIGFDNITRALFGDAAPMLLVPETCTGSSQLEHVLIAWNGSAESASAVRAALPLLQQAAAVHVLDGEPEGLPGLAPPRLALQPWLARHGVEVTWESFESPAHTGKALLDKARALDAQLLVMGAWGRSRLSELVLGGATRHVLEHAHLPLLMAH
ncbi:universal stress protein [Dyella sp.]|uniref:universal stress protein n=1 Tax=Dyella sp. TaxID=1869338 RepID=UPI002D79BD57|nr:universal stress protein [Dyella sp.]HET6433072.1 universal stress protein [Dyella sp.]